MIERETIQTYVCRLKRDRLLRVSDVAGAHSVHCADQLARVGRALIRDVPHEQVWVVIFDAANRVQGAVRVAEGGLHGAALRPVDVLRPVIVAGQGAFALIHNHPSGDPTPSVADREMTATLLSAAEVVGLRLLDHVVITTDPARWHSMGPAGDQ